MIVYRRAVSAAGQSLDHDPEYVATGPIPTSDGYLMKGGFKRSSQHLIRWGVAMARPGRLRSVQRQFWRLIAEGVATEEAGARVGVPSTTARRWFDDSGGMTPLTLDEPSGRYLSLSEREEIALARAAGAAVREIA